MALEGDQIVGVDKYPVSHRGIAYGARAAPSGSGTEQQPAERRNSTLETAGQRSLVLVRLRSCVVVLGWGPWPFRRRLMAVQRACFVDSMETVSDTPTEAHSAMACLVLHLAGSPRKGTLRHRRPRCVCTGCVCIQAWRPAASPPLRADPPSRASVEL
jgi:hypothetical protein